MIKRAYDNRAPESDHFRAEVEPTNGLRSSQSIVSLTLGCIILLLLKPEARTALVIEGSEQLRLFVTVGAWRKRATKHENGWLSPLRLQLDA